MHLRRVRMDRMQKGRKQKTMVNQKKWTRSLQVVTALILAIATVVSVASFLLKDVTEQLSNAIVKLTDKDINTNWTQYLNSSVMYKLPDTVKDTDDISVIIQRKTLFLLM